MSASYHRSADRALRGIARHLPQGIQSRLRRFRRSHAAPLHTLLPMPVPETIHIDPSNLCNFRCAFCPTADKDLLARVGRPNGTMDYSLFERIIGQLKDLVDRHNRRLSILHLYKDGEPLLHRRLGDMVALAEGAEVAQLVSVTTNGSLLDAKARTALLDAGLDQVRISVIHIDDAHYAELTQTWKDYDRIVTNVAALHAERNRRHAKLQIVAKVNDTALSTDELQTFRNDFGSIADELRVDTLMGWSYSELKDFTLGVEVSTGMDGTAVLRERAVCPEPFSRLAINFDGQVSVCCVDWSFGTIVGDLREQTLEEVWNGEALRRFRLTHLAGRRDSIRVCAECQYVKGAPESRDLDAHVERLRPLYDR